MRLRVNMGDAGWLKGESCAYETIDCKVVRALVHHPLGCLRE